MNCSVDRKSHLQTVIDDIGTNFIEKASALTRKFSGIKSHSILSSIKSKA